MRDAGVGPLLVLTVLSACARPSPLPPSLPAPVPSSPTTPVTTPVVTTSGAAVAFGEPPGAPSLGAPSLGAPSLGDVTRSAAGVFGATTERGGPSAGDGPESDLNVRAFADHGRVARYVDLFSTTARPRIEQRLSRGTRYEAMIRARLRAGGLPEDLYYLALVESGFDPDAYSRAAAVGMWQFMTTTARGLGMRVDRWVDERRDPLRATDGAVRFLNGLRDQFGSLYLAAAAYNGGPGRVARGLARYGDDLTGITGDSLFFALADQDWLRDETKNYVPQLIAAALVGNAPSRYGLRVDTQPPFAFDTLRVPGATPLTAVARAAGAAPEEVARLNPHVLRGMTPPGGTMVVRVPAGGPPDVAQRFDALPDEVRVASRVVRTRAGETAAAFAARVGVPVASLSWFGPKPARTRKGRLVAGQAVRVPMPTVAALARDVPDPAIERYGRTASRRLHRVRPGETLGRIARRYGTTTAALMRLNRLRRPVVYAGQALVVRGGGRTVSRPAPGNAKARPAKAKPTKAKPTKAKPAKAKPAKAKPTQPPNAKPPQPANGKPPRARQSETPRPR